MQYAVFVNRFLWELFSRDDLAEAVAYALEHGGEVYDCYAGKPVYIDGTMAKLIFNAPAKPARPQSAAAARVAKVEAFMAEITKRRTPSWMTKTRNSSAN